MRAKITYEAFGTTKVFMTRDHETVALAYDDEGDYSLKVRDECDCTDQCDDCHIYQCGCCDCSERSGSECSCIGGEDECPHDCNGNFAANCNCIFPAEECYDDDGHFMEISFYAEAGPGVPSYLSAEEGGGRQLVSFVIINSPTEDEAIS